jgi:hypothetical protein
MSWLDGHTTLQLLKENGKTYVLNGDERVQVSLQQVSQEDPGLVRIKFPGDQGHALGRRVFDDHIRISR